MILHIRSKALRLFFETGNRSKLQPSHVDKIQLILGRLNLAKKPEDMNRPTYNFHKLSGDLKDFWSVKVDKNYRIIFRFDGEDATDVDYLDYH